MLRVGVQTCRHLSTAWYFATQNTVCALLQDTVTSWASIARVLRNALCTMVPWSAILQDGRPIVTADLTSNLQHLQYELPFSGQSKLVHVVKVVCTSNCVFP
jgi:hypothetical protein